MLPSRRASARASGIRKRLAMACLSVIQKHYWKLRLGIVAKFTAIFAAVIGLLNVRRAEIFWLNGCLCSCVGGVREWEFGS